MVKKVCTSLRELSTLLETRIKTKKIRPLLETKIRTKKIHRMLEFS